MWSSDKNAKSNKGEWPVYLRDEIVLPIGPQ